MAHEGDALSTVRGHEVHECGAHPLTEVDDALSAGCAVVHRVLVHRCGLLGVGPVGLLVRQALEVPHRAFAECRADLQLHPSCLREHASQERRALEIAGERLRLERLSPAQRERIKLWHGSLTYSDARLDGFDAAAVVEVIEHLDPARLAAFERVVFERARPGTVVVTTPNVEYNVKFPSLPAGQFRHRDHRFEWTRAEFETWATGVAERFAYAVRFLPIGPRDPAVGAPSQMGVFVR